MPSPIRASDGRSFVEAGGMRWVLCQALEGQRAATWDWLGLRPKAAELLGKLHTALASATPAGVPFAPWAAWGRDTLDQVLAHWPAHPDLPLVLLRAVQERLADRYLGEQYPLLPKQVVHGDYTRAQVLWRGDGLTAHGSGVLGFAHARQDTVLADLAAGVGSNRPDTLRATVAAYSSVHALSTDEREALPEALLFKSVMRLDWHFTHLHDLATITHQAQEMQQLMVDLDVLREAVLSPAA